MKRPLTVRTKQSEAAGCFLVVVLIALLCAVPLGWITLYKSTIETVTVKVLKTERIVDGESSRYLVFTESEVFQCTDSILFWKWNSSDQYGHLNAGQTYKLQVVGWRVPFLFWYRNILTVHD